MLPKQRKLVQEKSASADANSSQSIISVFARQHSGQVLRKVQPEDQCKIDQTAIDLVEVTDGHRLNNRLSLSSRRKRLRTVDATMSTSSDTSNDADHNNTVNFSELSVIAPQSADKTIDDTDGKPNDSLSKSSVLYMESSDTDSAVSINLCGLDFPVNKKETLILDDNSASDFSSANQNAEDDESTRVPYYLEHFSLVLDAVFQDTFYAELFNDDDLSALHTFKHMSGNCISDEVYKLYLLFQVFSIFC